MLAVLALPVCGQDVWMKTATIVDGGHRLDRDTTGKMTTLPASLTNGLVMWQAFSFNDGVNGYDLSPVGNDCTATNANTTPSFSTVSGGVRDFDGVDDYFAAGSAPIISKDNTHTVAAWFKTDTVSAYQYIYGEDVNGSGSYFKVRVDAGATLRYSLFNGVWIALNTPTLTTNTWYHVAGTMHSSSGMKLYLNGIQVDTDAATTATPVAIDHAYIGCYTGTGSCTGFDHFFNGEIDEVMLWSRTLSSNEVFTLYSRGRP